MPLELRNCLLHRVSGPQLPEATCAYGAWSSVLDGFCPDLDTTWQFRRLLDRLVRALFRWGYLCLSRPAGTATSKAPPTVLPIGRSQNLIAAHRCPKLGHRLWLPCGKGWRKRTSSGSPANLQDFFRLSFAACPSQFSPVFEPSQRTADDVLHGHFLEGSRVGLALSQPTRRKPPHDVASPPSDSVRKKGPTRLAGGTRAPDALGVRCGHGY